MFLREQPAVLKIFKGAVRDPSKPVWDTGVFFSLFLGHSLPDLVGGGSIMHIDLCAYRGPNAL